MFIVLWQFSDIVKAELSETCLTPGKDVTLLGQRHRVGIATCKLWDSVTLQGFDLFGDGHEGASVYIERHLENVSKAELPT